MPGLVGTFERATGGVTGDVFERMVAPMRRGGRLVEESRVDAQNGWALGRTHLGLLQPGGQLREGGSIQALFHGDLHNGNELRESLRSCDVEIGGDDDASLIAALYRKEGRTFASKLRGAFCCVVLDIEKDLAVLANDVLGSYPVYWYAGPDRLVFASELKAVLREPSLRTSLDPRALADFFAFGFLFGDKTLAEGVRLLPSASTLVFERSSGDVSVERYRRIADEFLDTDDDQGKYLARLSSSFNTAVDRCLLGEHDYGVSLSGGLDSRAILSAIDCEKTPISTYTLGVEGCADQVIAETMAKIKGTKHRFFELDESYLSDFLPNLQEMVSLTDGMYLTHGLTEMLAMRFIGESDFNVLLRGHGGELAKTNLAWPLHTDAAIEGMTDRDEFISYMLGRVNYISSGVALRDLLAGEWFDRVDGGDRKSMEESLSDVPLPPSDLCSYLYLEEHHRRFTVPSLELFRNLVEVRLPFVDTDFLATLFGGPARWRSGTDIHRAVTRANHPKLLRVRNSNTGAPGHAGPLKEKILDKFNTLFKRMNLHGYRHYHNFDAWMKRTLLESVEEVMLDPSTIGRGIYQESTVRRMIDETRRGFADHAYLFQILLLVELWQRENVTEGVPA